MIQQFEAKNVSKTLTTQDSSMSKPGTFMNKNGYSIAKLNTIKKEIQNDNQPNFL